MESQGQQYKANRPLLGALIARMVREAVADGCWTVDADGRARPLDRSRGKVLQFPYPGLISPEQEEDHAAS